MEKPKLIIRNFFFSQYLADGLRITFAILAPVIILKLLGHFEAGLTISLGALCINITDIPGPLVHKRNGMLISALIVTMVGLLTSLIHTNLYFLTLEIILFTFLFSMFSVYGMRAGAVGSSALLIMILSMNKAESSFSEAVIRSFLILIGSFWYIGLSILLSAIRPYRIAQRSLGECIRETAKFLHIKASFYNSLTNLEDDYRDLMAQQIIVNEKQDAVRDLLFRTRQIVKDTSGPGKALMLTFVETIDLYEQITAVYHDYELIRKKYNESGILLIIAETARSMATELNHMGFAIQSNLPYKKKSEFIQQLNDIKDVIIRIKLNEPSENHLVLTKILLNLRHINEHLQELQKYFDLPYSEDDTTESIVFKPFINRQDFSFEIMKDNFTFDSLIFRHSVRVTIATLTGLIVAHLLNYGHHSYWIIMTIVFIMKPAFGLTKKRNFQRITGTVAGGIIGVTILYLFPNTRTEFIFLLFFMTCTYTFMRINYVTMVIFTTPYVLILLKLLGSGYINIIQERLIDTGIGCAIALIASYLLFPKWEADHLENHIKNVLRANLNYYKSIASVASGKKLDPIKYKLARKEVYVNSANLSAAFQRMLSEPQKKQKDSNNVFEFVVLNHILSSNIAALASTTISNNRLYTAEELNLLKRTLVVLQSCIKENNSEEIVDDILTRSSIQVHSPKNAEKSHFIDQLDFMFKLSHDIHRTTNMIYSK
jgi:uncharacterized membrane protein (TIGR01666 family)